MYFMFSGAILMDHHFNNHNNTKIEWTGNKNQLTIYLWINKNKNSIFSRVILTYLTSAYAKDDKLYPADIKVRALVDQRLHFDLSTLYQRMFDYYVRNIFCICFFIYKSWRAPFKHGWLSIFCYKNWMWFFF